MDIIIRGCVPTDRGIVALREVGHACMWAVMRNSMGIRFIWPCHQASTSDLPNLLNAIFVRA